MNRYDVIVIGSGNGGLGAAVKILSSGKSCLVLEKHNLPGGFATSFKRGRFEFEASLHEFNGIQGVDGQPGSTKALFDELGVSDKINWVSLHEAYHLYSEDDGYDFAMPFGIEEFKAANEKLVKGGAAWITKYFDLCDEIDRAIKYTTYCKGHPDSKILKRDYPNYLRCGSYSVNEVLDAMHMPPIIKANIEAYWCYLGADCDNLSFIHYANMMHRYIQTGAVVPSMRSHGISLAFVDRIRQLGGDIWLNSEVTRIECDAKGHVSGVILKDGRRIETRHVIADISPHIVYGRLMDRGNVPEKALRLSNFRKFSGRGFTLLLGLNKSKEELGIKDYSYFIYKTCDSAKTYQSMESLQKNGVQATVCLNNAIPDCSPKGTCILYFTTLFTSDVWSGVKEEDYYRTKDMVANGLIERFEKATKIKIRDSIEEIEIASPWTYARYCGHPEGVIYGYESTYYDGLMNRIQMVNEDHAVEGLRCGGGWGERLDGYPSSFKSGVNEAKRTLNDIKEEEGN